MNPPSIPELFSLSTITVMITITFLMQGSAIAFNSRMVKEYQGVRTAFLATLSLALGFGTILFRPIAPGFIIGPLSNVFVMTGHILIYVVIYRFVNKPLDRWLIYLILVGYLALLALSLFPRGIPVILVTQIVGFPLNLASAWTLHRSEHTRFKLGAYITALPLLVYGFGTVVRLVTGIISPREILPGPTASNIFDILLFYILSYLWTAGFILMISQRLQSDLHDLAMNDALTRIRNRRSMQSLLDVEMRRVETEVKDFSIILLDVDHFKRVNDTYGHDVGDSVLRWMAQTLQLELRVQDVVARWGGEEFLILMPNTTLDEAVQIGERLREKVEKTPVEGAPVPLTITFSGGVANSKTNRNVDQLCKIADQALYIAKRTRNTIISQDHPTLTINH